MAKPIQWGKTMNNLDICLGWSESVHRVPSKDFSGWLLKVEWSSWQWQTCIPIYLRWQWLGRDWDQWVGSWRLTAADIELCPWARHFICCLVLVQSKKTGNHPTWLKNCWLGCKASKQKHSYISLAEACAHYGNGSVWNLIFTGLLSADRRFPYIPDNECIRTSIGFINQ